MKFTASFTGFLVDGMAVHFINEIPPISDKPEDDYSSSI
jgi:hypothetical protein